MIGISERSGGRVHPSANSPQPEGSRAPTSSIPPPIFREVVAALPFRRPRDWFMYADARSSRGPVPQRYSGLNTNVPIRPEFNFVLKGSAVIFTGNQEFKLVPGRLLLIESGVEHGDVVEGPDTTVAYLIMYDTHVQVYLHQQQGMSVLDLLGITPLTPILDSIRSELRARDTGFAAALSGLLAYLAAVILRRLQRGSLVYVPQLPAVERFQPMDAGTWGIVEKALQYCVGHSQSLISRQDVAQEVGYSAVHLDRLFLRHLGKSVARHIRDIRMARAADMLANSGRTVDEVSVLLGYSEPASFRRAFRAARGTSPRQFRRGSRL